LDGRCGAGGSAGGAYGQLHCGVRQHVGGDDPPRPAQVVPHGRVAEGRSGRVHGFCQRIFVGCGALALGHVSRREGWMAVGRIEVVLACALACALLVAPAATASADETPRDSARAEIIRLLSLDDEALIDTIQERAFEYFWHEVNPENGLIRDRSTPWSPSSIAAVGFGLSAIPIG